MKRVILFAVCLGAVAWVGLRAQQEPADAAVVLPYPLQAIGGIHPRTSPNGGTIAFSYQGAIWTMPRDGGTMTRLTRGPGFDVEPAWSPDVKEPRIAFVRLTNMGDGELHLIHPSDGKEVPLPRPIHVRGNYNFLKLEFHPDGRRLLGVFRSGAKSHGLAWYDLKTGDVQSLVDVGPWSRYALSPDGRSIVYTTTMDVQGQQTGNNGPQTDLWWAPRDVGLDARKMMQFPSRVHDICFAAGGGSLIVVSELGGAHYDLWRVPFDQGKQSMKKMTHGQADEDRPSESRDGRWLVYTDNRHGATSFVVRDGDTGLETTPHVKKMDFGTATGKVRLKTRDGQKPVTARVSLLGAKYYAPPGALYRSLRGYGHFYCDKAAEFDLPAGKYSLRAFRGPEYNVAAREFEIKPGQTLDVDVALSRWTHAAGKGWHSGENHIHANYGYGQWYNTPRSMLEQCAGEDLNVCNFMVANSDTDGVFDRAFFRGGPDPISTGETILYWNQEFRSTLWGHMTLVNLNQVVEPVFTGFQGTTNPWDVPTNSDIGDKAHWQKDAVVNYTHIAQNPDDPFQNPYAGKGIPVDAALGKFDTLDINNSYQGAVPVWHRLLNCGFRIPATAGTDCFLNRIVSQLPGGDRVYVKCDGGLNYDSWIQGLKNGRSFVTNGPMLELTVDGRGLGDTIKTPAPRLFKVVGKASAAFPLAKVEVIYNGKPLVEGKMAKDDLSGEIEADITPRQSGWFALRATGPGHPDSAKPLLYAHTNPIYVEIAGARPSSREDALFFLAWIDKLSLEVRARDRVPNEAMRRHIQEQLEAARAVYAKMAK